MPTATLNPVYTSGDSNDGSRAIDNAMYAPANSGVTTKESGVTTKEGGANGGELVLTLKVGLGASWVLTVVLFIVLLVKQCEDCHVGSIDESAESSYGGGAIPANTNSTTGGVDTTNTAAYIPQSCHGVNEASGCGSRIPLLDCDEDSDHGDFAKQHCPQMCRLGCTPTTTTATTTRSTETSTSATTTSTTATATTSTTITLPPPPWGDSSLRGNASLILQQGGDATRAAAFLPQQIEEVLGSQFPADTTTWKLLYRGTRDGFDASVFHERCDNQGATVTVIKSESGHIFGGVTIAAWDPCMQYIQTTKGMRALSGLHIITPGRNCYSYTTGAFLYGIRTYGSPDAAVSFKAKHVNGQLYTQQSTSLKGPTFGYGQGDGLGIADHANKNTLSYSAIGTTYGSDSAACTTKDANGYNHCRTYFTGGTNFKVAEIEVYQLVNAHPVWGVSLILQEGGDRRGGYWGPTSQPHSMYSRDSTRAAAFLPQQIEEVLGSQFPADTTTWKLLYRGTRDGFDASVFHERCDNQGATVTMVKSESGHIFGGVTGAAWSSCGCHVNTTKAFLYGIRTYGSPDAGVIFKLSGNSEVAMLDNPNSGPTFGGGHDLYIATDANGNANSYSNLGMSGGAYAGNGMQTGIMQDLRTGTWSLMTTTTAGAVNNTDDRHHFTGTQNFTITEIEVFKLV